jgi:chemotaxis protein methyltransferase CheR
MSKHDYLLSDARYERFQKLILTRTGLLFGSKRHHALGKGVLAQAQAAANGDLDMYLSLLTDAETDSPLWDALIDALTIGETYFFRDNCQIQALRQHILPLIISEHQHDRKIRIWSAGCASGEEPYTLAMLLSELIFGIDQWNITILATDINKQVLKKGARARYRSWSFRQTDATVQSRYFRYRQGEYQLVQGIRQYVQFAYLNLNEPVYPSLATNTHAMDLILCRNVAISPVSDPGGLADDGRGGNQYTGFRPVCDTQFFSRNGFSKTIQPRDCARQIRSEAYG